MALLDQVYYNATDLFQNDPALRELLRSTMDNASRDTEIGLTPPPGVPGGPAPGAIPPQITGPNKTDKLTPEALNTFENLPQLPARSEPISPEYLALLDQAQPFGGGASAPGRPMPQTALGPQVSAGAPQYGPGPVQAPLAGRPVAAAPTSVPGGPMPMPANMAKVLPSVTGSDKLMAFLSGLGSSDAILPALGGGMQSVRNLELQEAGRNQTMQALIRRGVDPDTALAAIVNPEIMKSILPNVFGKAKTFGTIGHDSFGQPIMGWIDPEKETTRPANPDGSSGAGASSLTAAEQANLSGEPFLKTLAPPLATMIKKYANGELPIPTGAALRNPQMQRMIQMVAQYDPTFDAINYGTRAAVRKSFTSGKDAANLASFNTTMQHIEKFAKTVKELNNSRYPIVNRLTNWVQPELGDTRVGGALNAFHKDAHAVASELTTAFRGSNGNVHDVVNWEKGLNPDDPTETLMRGVQEAIGLLQGRIDAIGEKYNKGMGKVSDPLMLLSPGARKAIAELNPDIGNIDTTSPSEIDKLTGGKSSAGPTATESTTTREPSAAPTPHDFGEDQPGMQHLQDGSWVMPDPKSPTGYKRWTPPVRKGAQP